MGQTNGANIAESTMDIPAGSSATTEKQGDSIPTTEEHNTNGANLAESTVDIPEGSSTTKEKEGDSIPTTEEHNMAADALATLATLAEEAVESNAAVWDGFATLHDEDLTVLFSSHLGPTDLFKDHMNKPELSSSVLAYSNQSTGEIFTISRELALKSLASQTQTSGDLIQATKDVFAAALQGDSQLPSPLPEQITRHALALAKTSPDVFGSNFQLNILARQGEFSLPVRSNNGHEHERYDIVQWIVSFTLLGKAFDLEDWDPIFAKSIVAAPDADEVVAEIALGDQGTLEVTHQAKSAMDIALSLMATRPAAIFSCKQAVVAVCYILGKELLSYTMPQTADELNAFDWDTVVPGDTSTYPHAPPPPKADFDVVKAVHGLSKAEKDAEAVLLGMTHSGAPSYASYKQKWKMWRDIHAIFRTMNPQETLATCHNRVLICCKSRNSVLAMQTAVEGAIKGFIADRARAKRKVQLALELAVREAAEKEAEEKAKQLEAEKAQAMQGLTPSAPGGRVTTRRGAEANQKQQEAVVAEVVERINEASAEVLGKRLEAEKLRRERQKLIAKEARDKTRKKVQAKRYQVQLLDINPSPRKKAAPDNGWAPPKLIKPGGMYSQPGAHWKGASIKKLQLLHAFRNQLTVAGMLERQMTLALVMEFLGADGDDTTFQERVFLYLLFLLISAGRYVQDHQWSLLLNPSYVCHLTSLAHFASSNNDTIGILLEFIKKGWQSAEEMVAASAEEVQVAIDDFETDQDSLGLAKSLLQIASEIQNNHHGMVPQTKLELQSIGLKEPLPSLLMQQAYGASSELVISLSTRKVLVALDMVDWEEFGSKSKSEVKMGKVTPEKVKKSLRTWLPRGEGILFHDTMDSVGSLILARGSGLWGKLDKVISSHFASKEKEALLEMANTIFQFSKISRASPNKGGKKKKPARNEDSDDD
jgi:hypothetical protein